MTRAHLYTVAQDDAGNALKNAVVRILQPGTENPIAAPFYADDTTITAMTNPFTTASGAISIYIDTAQRVRLGITPVSGTEQFIDDIDVGGAGAGSGPSDHVGDATGSTKVGVSSSSVGTNSTAMGQSATSGGASSVAFGNAADASGANASALGKASVASASRATAVGEAASASATSATAVGTGAAGSNTQTTSLGDSAVANSAKATALGASSTAGYDHSTAVGAEAVTSEANQVMLGNGLDFAESPGGYILVASDGKRGRLRMLPDGSLTTIWHIGTANTNLLPATEQTFETSLGSWAAVSGMAVSQSTDYALAGTNSMKMVLSGAAAASARSSKVSAVVGTVYVGQARMFYHAGAATAGLNGTCWLEFYDGSDVIIGTATVGRTRAFFPDTWIYFDVRAVAPATTATVCLRVGLPTGGGANLDAFYADSAGIWAVPGSI